MSSILMVLFKRGTLNRIINFSVCRDCRSYLISQKIRNINFLQIVKLTSCAICNVSHSSKLMKDNPINLQPLPLYEQVAEETLQSISDHFEELLENSTLKDWDVNYSNGVLKISLEKNGVYVLNKQTPNRQIWLSSPLSGPKRYDYINGIWLYKHDGKSLHQLLTEELSDILKLKANFKFCSFGS